MEPSNAEIVNLKIETPVKTVHLGDAMLQRGYVYSCKRTGEEPELENGSGFGYHGTDVPPCAAEHLCDLNEGDGYLVISTEEHASAIEAVDGWTLAPADVGGGDYFADGTWCVAIVKCHGGHEFTVAGTL